MQGLHNKYRTVLIFISFGQTVVQVYDASVCAVFAIKDATNIHDKTIIISNVRLFFSLILLFKVLRTNIVMNSTNDLRKLWTCAIV